MISQSGVDEVVAPQEPPLRLQLREFEISARRAPGRPAGVSSHLAQLYPQSHVGPGERPGRLRGGGRQIVHRLHSESARVPAQESHGTAMRRSVACPLELYTAATGRDPGAAGKSVQPLNAVSPLPCDVRSQAAVILGGNPCSVTQWRRLYARRHTQSERRALETERLSLHPSIHAAPGSGKHGEHKAPVCSAATRHRARSFIERELQRAQIAFRKNDNASLAGDDLAALQAAADRTARAGRG